MAVNFIPIVVVVSLLGFFVLLTLLIFVGQYLRTRDRRKRQRQIASGNEKPTRHLTVRSGKVVPRSQAIQTASTRHLDSLDLSSLKSGYSSKSKVTLEKPQRSVHQMDQSEPTRSSAYTDLEAQDPELEKRWEENMKPFHPDERFMESWKAINSRSRKAERSTSQPGKRPMAISGQKIAESLRKGYNGPPALAGQPVEVPTAAIPRVNQIHTLPRKKTNDSGVSGLLKTKKGEVASEQSASSRTRKDVLHVDPGSNISRSPRVSFSLPGAIQTPLPVHTASAHRPHTRTESPTHHHPVSFLSSSESPASSAMSQVTPSPVNAPPPSPADISPSPIVQPTPDTEKPKRTLSTESRRNRPPDINTNVPDIRDTSFIDSADSSAKSNSDLRRGHSIMSNHSVLTFASSEISSVWTFGNAQPVAIVASVTPRSLAMHPSAMMPKSKYGRRVKSRREKALPILPKSPLRVASGRAQ